MKFNDKYLSIPPYISTSWDNVKTLQMSGSSLLVTLNDNTQVSVPGLDLEELEDIFDAHLQHLDKANSQSTSQPNPSPASMGNPAEAFGFPSGTTFPFKFGNGIEAFGSALQHNPEHANAPNMPEEILSKISTIAKLLAPEESMEAPQPEPHCNCPHCQIARAINEGMGNPVRPYSCQEDASPPEVDVDDKELNFQQWEIEQVGSQLFKVINRLDKDEVYNVFLGTPIGCTCGKEGCEHILAVLRD